MLVELTVENIAIIERSQVVLGPGLTVLTGETGAGKSLLVDAIELALGERADSELVRTGATKGCVSAVFDLSGSPDLLDRCREVGIDLDDGTLYLQREVFAEGRSQCRAGGKQIPLSSLKQLGRYLVDLHGQHDHQSLLDPSRHIGFLDAWIGDSALGLLEALAEAHAQAVSARQKLASLRNGLREREQRLDMLRFQVQEIEAVNPKVGEMGDLEIELSRLANAERLALAVGSALQSLNRGDGNAVDSLRTAVSALESGVRLDGSLMPGLEGLRGALIQMDEEAHGLSAYLEDLDGDPHRLEEAAGRVDDLRKLRRKYGDDEAAVLAFLDRARAEVELLTDAESSEETLLGAQQAAEAQLNRLANSLSEVRQTRAEAFSNRVLEQLRDLAMDRARFEVHFGERSPDAGGKDEVEFFFSANAGELPRPLGKIASGGEISRVMLAIKTAMAGGGGVPTLIFDEVDAGLGGRAAATVARKLEELAEHAQAIVISHLPQIASRALTHFRIEKVELNGRVVTSVRQLDADERVDEIARMLAGEEITESARANAQEMLISTTPAS